MDLSAKIKLHLLDSGYVLLEDTSFGGLWREPAGPRTMSFEWAVKHCLENERSTAWLAEVECFLGQQP